MTMMNFLVCKVGTTGSDPVNAIIIPVKQNGEPTDPWLTKTIDGISYTESNVENVNT